jgi:hypothetical protein
MIAVTYLCRRTQIKNSQEVIFHPFPGSSPWIDRGDICREWCTHPRGPDHVFNISSTSVQEFPQHERVLEARGQWGYVRSSYKTREKCPTFFQNVFKRYGQLH